ncbi:MAG: hypothetical protein KC656_09355 [Myxococcales bacterium]|nr:hypothetical protein [Myxococcales bacterium]
MPSFRGWLRMFRDFGAALALSWLALSFVPVVGPALLVPGVLQAVVLVAAVALHLHGLRRWPRLLGGVLYANGWQEHVALGGAARVSATSATTSRVFFQGPDGVERWMGGFTHEAARRIAHGITEGRSVRTRPRLGRAFWGLAAALSAGLVALVFAPPHFLGFAFLPGGLLVFLAVWSTRVERWGLERVDTWETFEDQPRVVAVTMPLTARKHLPRQRTSMRVGALATIAGAVMNAVWVSPSWAILLAPLGIAFVAVWVRAMSLRGYWPDYEQDGAGPAWALLHTRKEVLGPVEEAEYDDGRVVVWATPERGLQAAAVVCVLAVAATCVGLELGWLGRPDLRAVPDLSQLLLPVPGAVGFALAGRLIDLASWSPGLWWSGRQAVLWTGRDAHTFVLDDATFEVHRRRVRMSLQDGRVVDLPALAPEQLAEALRSLQRAPAPVSPDAAADAARLRHLVGAGGQTIG